MQPLKNTRRVPGQSLTSRSRTVHLISLGCAKNTVDSASMAELLAREGYQLSEHAGRAGVIIVNTCGFIGPARDESFQVLGDLAARKRKGQLLIAAGCLTQRYGAEVARRVPGIDGILGTRRWMDIVEVVQKLDRERGLQPVYHLPETPTAGGDERGVPRLAVQGGSAYLKIADGCRRPCAFCAIPLIKGTAVSRSMEAILQDARFLVSADTTHPYGVREINLIAQDTTDYGYDLGLKDGLALLLGRMTDPELYGWGDPDGGTRPVPAGKVRPNTGGSVHTDNPLWIRILYAYPGYITDRLIEIMATRPQIVHYLDMPLQHAHPDTLRRMRRPANIEWVYNTLEKMRRQIPDLALRTTFIVGYPGETEDEFQTLLDFVKAMRFDRVGTFQFSFETGTPSEPLGDPIPAEVKEERYNRLMELQHGISLEINQTFVGKTLPVLIEGQEQPERVDCTRGILIGRSYRDAPEIDGVVVVRSERDVRSERGIHREKDTPDETLIGKIVPVRITGAMAYDLNGVLESRGGFNIDRPQ
jgi:ribosomal protein S12 methylthiotransferase